MATSIHRLKARSLRDAARNQVQFADEIVAACYSAKEHTDIERPEQRVRYAEPSHDLRLVGNTRQFRVETDLELSDVGLAYWRNGTVTLDVDIALAEAVQDLVSDSV